MPPPDDMPDDEALTILKGIPDVWTLPIVPLPDYRSLARQVPRPTADQIAAFAAHVAQAKSWYKHLPFFPPGAPFHVFVDPWAGLDRVRTRDQGVIFGTRTATTPRFHYTWLTTDDYRARFGHLAFSCAEGSRLYHPIGFQIGDGPAGRGIFDNNPDRAALVVPGYGEYQLPGEIHDGGRVDLTAVIHPHAASPAVCLAALRASDEASVWPAASGGPEVVAQLRARCREIEEAYRRAASPEARPRLDEIDEELERLLAPERRRLHGEIVSALERVVEALFGSGLGSS